MTLASSSFGPLAACSWRSTTFAPSTVGALTETTSAVPPDGSASNDFGRIKTSFGSGPSNFTSTICAPPKIAVFAPSAPVTSVALLISVDPVLAESRDATSRAS